MRSNNKVWYSLGFINDLSVSFGTGIENDVHITMVSFWYCTWINNFNL